MTDVRLTAVNPEDSQVYPVACNDKGELLLDSGGATGDLDVTGNLTVAGQATVGPIGSGGAGFIVLPDGQSAFYRQVDTVQSMMQLQSDVGGTQVPHTIFSTDGSAIFAGGAIELKSSGQIFSNRTTGSGAVFYGNLNGTNTSSILADGSATFASDIQIPREISGSTSANGLTLYSAGHIYASRDAANNLWVGRQTGTPGNTSTITANGAATFKHSIGLDGRGGNDLVFFVKDTGASNATTVVINANGSANFSGNVTAPNINFKLAPETVAAMPAPLIDEGFAANNEVDLLSVLMEMKLQIRDLNAFMQRSTQDDPET